jgi:trans-aconitate 2-methyltransferase
MNWDPQQYNKFEVQRWRPALDLLAALPADLAPRSIVDLGCGTGRLARVLADRFPEAEVVGIDDSAAMLAKAAAVRSRVIWVEAEMGEWQPRAPIDLIVSNAALHWLDNHDRLFPRLVGAVASGGALAVQMPRNFGEPSHAILRNVASDPRWADRVRGGLLGDIPVHAPELYYDWLAPCSAAVEIWETIYLQVLDGDNAVLEWLKGTALRSVIAALTPGELDDFMARCTPALAAAYPRRPDGCTLFPFRRLFMIARAG